MKNKFFIFLFFFCLLIGFSAPIKVKVTVDNASLKATPQIGAKTLAKIPLNTILEAKEKQGEWYQVSVDREGIKLSGYIHEVLVAVVAEEGEPAVGGGVPAAAEKPQAEIVNEISLKIEENRNLVRQDKKYEEALNSLLYLIAKAFTVTNLERQKELAAEIFLLRGLAQAGRGDEVAARKEFRNIYEISQTLAKEVQKNIFDPGVLVLFQQAEKDFLGYGVEFSIIITSEPPGAKIRINGKEIGVTPEIYKIPNPRLILELEKETYKTVREEIQLTKSTEKKEYKLELAGAFITINSQPEGAKIFLDGKDTGKTTNDQLFVGPFGTHQINLVKKNYLESGTILEILEGNAQETLDTPLIGMTYVYSNKWGGVKNPLFIKPIGVAIDKANHILVVDESNVKFKVLSTEGGVLSSGALCAKEVRDLKSPGGIAVDSRGNIYITDAKRDCVLKMDAKRNLISLWGKSGAGDEELNSPKGIAIDQSDHVYIVNSGNNCMKKFTPDGIFIKTWGRKGAKDGEFLSPRAVAVNQKGQILVLDSQRVQKFSAEGDFLGSWGKAGKGEGELNNPEGINIDRTNCVYIGDSGNHRIQKFDENGKFICAWGAYGVQNGQLNSPCGIAVDGRGTVYVLERDNNRVQLFVVS